MLPRTLSNHRGQSGLGVSASVLLAIKALSGDYNNIVEGDHEDADLLDLKF